MRRETEKALARLRDENATGWPRVSEMTGEQALRLLDQPQLSPPRRGRIMTAEVVGAAKQLLRGSPGLSAKQIHWRLVGLGFRMGSDRATRMLVADLRHGRR